MIWSYCIMWQICEKSTNFGEPKIFQRIWKLRIQRVPYILYKNTCLYFLVVEIRCRGPALPPNVLRNWFDILVDGCTVDKQIICSCFEEPSCGIIFLGNEARQCSCPRVLQVRRTLVFYSSKVEYLVIRGQCLYVERICYATCYLILFSS